MGFRGSGVRFSPARNYVIRNLLQNHPLENHRLPDCLNLGKGMGKREFSHIEFLTGKGFKPMKSADDEMGKP